jgi:two-component system cell cycle sensor histidine kinase/response regulator CckA
MANTELSLATCLNFPLAVPLSGAARILLVEDERFLRNVIQHVLTDAGYEVIVAKDAGEAERHFTLSAGRIDLLITDVVLPGRNGARLAADLAKLRPKLKSVLISGYPERVVRDCQRGAVKKMVYLAKPFTAEILTRKVREVLKRDI